MSVNRRFKHRFLPKASIEMFITTSTVFFILQSAFKALVHFFIFSNTLLLPHFLINQENGQKFLYQFTYDACYNPNNYCFLMHLKTSWGVGQPYFILCSSINVQNDFYHSVTIRYRYIVGQVL